MTNNPYVLGVFRDREQLNDAVAALRDHGFESSAVSVLMPHNLQSKQAAFAVEPADQKTKAGDGATVGAGSGAVVGGALGWLAGMGAIVIPGVGPFFALGPLIGTLLGAGTGGAVGGFLGTLIGVGIPESDARVYEGRMIKGDSLLVVQSQTPQQMQVARVVLEQSGADKISSSSSREAQNTSAA
jgi:hypothetical protein